MTLIVHNGLKQGSEEWLSARCGILTASTIGRLITAKTVKPANNDTPRGLTMSLIAERITRHVEPVHVTADMERGNLSEPLARGIYSEHYAPVHEVGMFTLLEDDRRLGYSPDGLVDDCGLIEIKSPRQKTHVKTLLADAVPEQYMAQCQTGLFVTGREWIDFVSYCGGLPLYVKRVFPDPQWQQVIGDVWHAFEDNAAETIKRYEASVKDRPMTERVDFYNEEELIF